MLLLSAAHVINAAHAVAGGTDPGPVPVPGLQAPLDTVIGWGKWMGYFFGFIGLGICGIQMMLGRRNRHSFAADGAAGIPWVLGGLTLIAIAGGIVGTFLQP